ncbi:MAG: AAA family ATPase [Patescibacteria group bacterium]
MFLKSLELNGFKSFASKTTLEFPRGITAIVGPNGSGKSNIIDAIRWLLGEREAKNLRGSKIENLIFAGTPKRPRTAMAQVGLFFENNSKLASFDFNEISVVRRATRDGNSQYFINKSETRLKDLIDFFARARLGTKGLTIINQGSSDLFVKATPEERKTMIEEVLGLREFQIKKSEAERKLGNTNINLEKAKALVEEVIPRLRMLKRQTAKWEKRQDIENELRELENNYFSNKFGEIEIESRKLESPLNELLSASKIKSNELKQLEEDIKKLEEKSEKYSLREIKEKKNQSTENHLKIQKELARIEATLELISIRETDDNIFDKEELLMLLNEIKNDLEANSKNENASLLLETAKNLVEKINKFLNQPNIQKSEKIRELEDSKNRLLKEIQSTEAELKHLEEIENKTTDELEGFNKNFQKAYELLEAKKEEISKLENQKQKIAFEKEKLGLKFQDIKNYCYQIGRQIDEFKSIIPEAMENPLEIERKMLKLRAELSSIGEIDQSLIKEATETENHYTFLLSQSGDLEKAIEDLKNLIEELRKKINFEFDSSLKLINDKFDDFFRLMFEGGHAKLKIQSLKPKIQNNEEPEIEADENDKAEEKNEFSAGIDIELNLPKKRITSLEMLSGGEKSLVSIAALFALISVSPPPFLVLDEIDAPLDEKNSTRFANLIKEFSHQTQFIIVTHNRSVMESANVLYGVTMNDDGTSKVISLKLDN